MMGRKPYLVCESGVFVVICFCSGGGRWELLELQVIKLYGGFVRWWWWWWWLRLSDGGDGGG